MIHVVARSQVSGDQFLTNHPSLEPQIRLELGTGSYFQLLSRLIATSTLPVVCVVHDDVMLCADFDAKINALVCILNDLWPNWGLAGNAGVLPLHLGYSATEVVRYLSDPHGGPNLVGHILPAQSIDGNVMLLNVGAMREKGLTLPALDGFQLYDVILSTETISAGLGVFVCPQLACWHGSEGNQEEFDRAKSSNVFKSYLLSRIRNKRLKTLNGVVEVKTRDAEGPQPPGIDVQLESLRTAVRGTPRKTVAIIIRTQYRRPSQLSRALDSVYAFIAAGGDVTKFRSYVLTDSSCPEGVDPQHKDTSVLRANLPSDRDSRYHLVRFAAETIEADYFWFVDDDDWVFPNEAQRLGLMVCAAPAGTTFFLDSQHFDEPELVPGLGGGGFERAHPGRYFPANEFLSSLSGFNYTPLCGVIFSRSTLISIPKSVYSTVVYYEDFMTILFAILSPSFFPVVVGRLYAGISVRATGNTITETDRSKWNRSMAELVSHLVSAPGLTQLLSLSGGFESSTTQLDPRSLRALLADREKALVELHQSTSWRITRPLRGVARVLRGEIGLAKLLKGF